MPELQKNIAILCNPLADVGKAVKITKHLTDELQNKKIHYSLFDKQWPHEFTGFTEVWIVGGDGTVNYFINHYPEILLPFAVFKGGTGNDFHWLLYGNINVKDQLEQVLNTSPKPIDLCKCNEKYFINGVGIGFEGSVVQSLVGKKKMPGKTSFYITILKKIFFFRSKYYSIVHENYDYSGYKLMVSITNGRRAGGGFYISPKAKADDGLLDVVLVNKLNPLLRLRYLPVIEKGKHLKLHFVTHFTTQHINIKSDKLMHYHLDGEYCTANEINVEILKHKLRVLY